MNIQLPRELQEYVANAVQSGRYKDESDAVAQAVTVWRTTEVSSAMLDDPEFRRSLHEIAERMESGEDPGVSMEDMRSELMKCSNDRHVE